MAPAPKRKAVKVKKTAPKKKPAPKQRKPEGPKRFHLSEVSCCYNKTILYFKVFVFNLNSKTKVLYLLVF